MGGDFCFFVARNTQIRDLEMGTGGLTGIEPGMAQTKISTDCMPSTTSRPWRSHIRITCEE